MREMNYFLTEMREEHIGAIAGLEKICFSEPWSENSLREEIENPDAFFIAAVTDDGSVAGYAGMHISVDGSYVDNIAVFPEYRKSGVGEALTRALIWKALSAGEFITLEVRESNLPAVRLYEKLGFEPVGKRRNFYSSPREDAVIYTLNKCRG